MCFGGLAESVTQYPGQGRRVAVSGRLDEWETTSVSDARATKVVADEVQFLGGPG